MNSDKIVIYNFKVVIWVTAIVGLVLVGDSGFVELQLILNSLTGENLTSPEIGPSRCARNTL